MSFLNLVLFAPVVVAVIYLIYVVWKGPGANGAER